MNRILFLLSVALLTAGCQPQGTSQASKPSSASAVATNSKTLAEVRKDFKTKLVSEKSSRDPVDVPPAAVFSKIQYDSPVGKLAAYLTPDPKDGKKHPAIIWITGGDCNSIGECWKEAEPENNQTADAYRKAGIIMMFPSLRGGNQNPGTKEGFLGEVDDVIAAADHLAKQPYVDAKRIYLGGHSTGGTLVLLVSESADRFRAVFSFGPVDDVASYRGYGHAFLPFDFTDNKEMEVRSPGNWLATIKSPTYVIEGTNSPNIRCLKNMDKSSTNGKVHFIKVNDATHFSVLTPTNRLLAEKIIKDEGAECILNVTEDEVNKAFKK